MRKRILLFVILWVALLVPAAHAGTKLPGLQITPLRSRPVQKPGDTTAGQITVTNNTTESTEVALSVERFKVVDEAYNYNFAPGEYTDWVRLTDTKVTLEKNAAKKIAYSLAVPLDASPGGYYFAVFASSENRAATTSFKEVRRVASLIYLEVSGLSDKKVNLLGVDAAWFNKTRSASSQSRLANQGNVHYAARLKQTIRPLLGARSSNTKESLILPGTIRKVTSSVELPWVPGIYKLKTEFAPPQGGSTQYVNQLIVYVPLWFWVVVGALVIVGIFSLILRRRKRKKYTKKTA